MAKTKKEIEAYSQLVDLFVVVLDARAPFASYNEELDYINPSCPRLFLVAKSDLGDNQKYDNIKKQFCVDNNNVLFLNLKSASARKKFITTVKRLTSNKKSITKIIKIIVLGVPNTGKSTLINLLRNKKSVKVGNEAGITKHKQWINVEDVFLLLDTPGILTTKEESSSRLIKLFVVGAIKSAILPLEWTYQECFKLLSATYPEKIESLGVSPSEHDAEIYNNAFLLAKNYNFYSKGQKLDTLKAMSFFVEWVKKLRGVSFE